jgi:hypothetical protein
MRDIKVISRSRGICIIEDNNGKRWLAKRKKLRHDNRRKKPHTTGKRSVIYIPIKEII